MINKLIRLISLKRAYRSNILGLQTINTAPLRKDLPNLHDITLEKHFFMIIVLAYITQNPTFQQCLICCASFVYCPT